MRNIKRNFLVGLTAGCLILSSLQVFAQGNGENEIKVDKNVPVSATEVTLAKKLTEKDKVKGTDYSKGSNTKVSKSTNAATGVLGAQLGTTAVKYAIIIGISDYPGTTSDLGYCDDDAVDVDIALKTRYGFKDENIIKFINPEGTEYSGGVLTATRQNILSAIETVSLKANPEDEVVFYYSGHGGNGRAADGDTEATDECIWTHDGTNFLPIWDGELKAAFRNYKTSRIAFVFDSCYAGGMTDLAAPGRLLAMGSSENSLSYEWESLGNGEFTYYMFEQGMTNGAADKYGHNVTVEEAYDYAKANRINNSPTISDKFTNDLCLGFYI